MNLEITDFETGVPKTYTIEEFNPEMIYEWQQSDYEKKDFDRAIDNLDLSADQKSFVYKFKEYSVKVGSFVIKVGKKIIELVLNFLKKYPGTSFGLVLGLLVASLIPSHISILGKAILGTLFLILKVITTLFFLYKGWKDDQKDMVIKDHLSVVTDKLLPLLNLNTKEAT